MSFEVVLAVVEAPLDNPWLEVFVDLLVVVAVVGVVGVVEMADLELDCTD